MTKTEILVAYVAAMAGNMDVPAERIIERAKLLTDMTIAAYGDVWVDHDGLGTPKLPPHAKVYIRTANGLDSERVDDLRTVEFWAMANNWWDKKNKTGVYITAYKVVP